MIIKRFIALVLLLSLCTGLCACAEKVNASSATLLTPKDAAIQSGEADLSKDFYSQQNDLAWKLFSSALAQSDGENVLLSPLSIQIALCMTANGADGTTLEEMEALLCGEYSIADMNELLAAYLCQLPSGEKAKLHIANSIWYRHGEKPIAIQEDFLNTCAYHYGAQAYRAPFDNQTVKDINNWVSENTDGMIDKLISDLGPDTAMVLINALCFDAKWQSIYTDADISDGVFTAQSGQQQEAEYMYSQENRFLELANATGFIKNYAAGEYKFAALLPNEGVDIYDFVATLSPETLYGVLSSPQQTTVRTYLPKFSCEYSLNMNELIMGLGMEQAFDGEFANFSKMSDTPLCISEVIHKTRIDVDENGTKAAAATAVIMGECAMVMPEDYREVRLNRPFVYMILDGNNVPLFIGVVTELN